MIPRMMWRGWGWWVLLWVGVLLSPLTPYNDLAVNIPIARALSWPVQNAAPDLYRAALMGAYAFTNYLGVALVAAALPNVDTPMSRRVAGSFNGRKLGTQNRVGLFIATITVIVIGVLDAFGVGVDPLQLIVPGAR